MNIGRAVVIYISMVFTILITWFYVVVNYKTVINVMVSAVNIDNVNTVGQNVIFGFNLLFLFLMIFAHVLFFIFVGSRTTGQGYGRPQRPSYRYIRRKYRRY